MKAQGLEGKRSSGNYQAPYRIAFLFFLFLVGATVYNLLLSPFNLFKTLELQNSLSGLERKKAELKEENKRLEQLLSSIEKNPEYYKERFIREYMQLQREGDRVIIFND